MKRQFDQTLMSSAKLFFDHRITNSGQAYFNHTGLFYPVATNPYQGRYTYALPYRPLVNDSSVQGATVMTGVYLNGTYVTPGTSGLLNINHDKGTIDFSTSLPAGTSVSGQFSVREVNIELTTHLEDQIISEGKFHKNPKFTENVSGLPLNSYPIPAIFLKKRGGSMKPFAIGGTDLSVIDVRAMVVADNEAMVEAIGSLLKDTHYRRIELIENPPFNFRGEYTGANYNYTGIVSGPSSRDGPLIQEVVETRVMARFGEDALKNKLYASFLDFKISHVRDH